MASYVMLFRFTEQGMARVKQSPDRIDALKKTFEANGARIKDSYLMLGEYDTIFIAEAPNDETIAKLALIIASQGNVHVATHRAFGEAEFRNLVTVLP